MAFISERYNLTVFLYDFLKNLKTAFKYLLRIDKSYVFFSSILSRKVEQSDSKNQKKNSKKISFCLPTNVNEEKSIKTALIDKNFALTTNFAQVPRLSSKCAENHGHAWKHPPINTGVRLANEQTRGYVSASHSTLRTNKSG